MDTTFLFQSRHCDTVYIVNREWSLTKPFGVFRYGCCRQIHPASEASCHLVSIACVEGAGTRDNSTYVKMCPCFIKGKPPQGVEIPLCFLEHRWEVGEWSVCSFWCQRWFLLSFQRKRQIIAQWWWCWRCCCPSRLKNLTPSYMITMEFFRGTVIREMLKISVSEDLY